MKTVRVRNWCFTQFTKEKPKFVIEHMEYMTYQLERCQTTLREHWQGYVELKDKVSMKRLKELLENKEVHCEIRKGTQTQAIDYCHKLDTRIEDQYYELGEMKKQGSRNDLDNIVDAIEDGMTGREILLQFRGNALRHMGMIQRGLEAFHALNNIGVIDKTILLFRPEKCPEVTGNTDGH